MTIDDIISRRDSLNLEKESLVQERAKMQRETQEIQEKDQNVIQRLIAIDGAILEFERLMSIEIQKSNEVASKIRGEQPQQKAEMSNNNVSTDRRSGQVS